MITPDSGSRERKRESTSADLFIKNLAFSTAKMTDDESGFIDFSIAE